MDAFSDAYRDWIQEAVNNRTHLREGKWTESIAVGSAAFVAATKDKLGVKGLGREVIGGGESYELREPPASYMVNLGNGNAGLRLENTYFWKDNS